MGKMETWLKPLMLRGKGSFATRFITFFLQYLLVRIIIGMCYEFSKMCLGGTGNSWREMNLVLVTSNSQDEPSGIIFTFLTRRRKIFLSNRGQAGEKLMKGQKQPEDRGRQTTRQFYLHLNKLRTKKLKFPTGTKIIFSVPMIHHLRSNIWLFFIEWKCTK